jgi:hypothetical protein
MLARPAAAANGSGARESSGAWSGYDLHADEARDGLHEAAVTTAG